VKGETLPSPKSRVKGKALPSPILARGCYPLKGETLPRPKITTNE